MASLKVNVRMGPSAIYQFHRLDMVDLTKAIKAVSFEIEQIDNKKGGDAYSFECARNDRTCLAREFKEMTSELLARFNNIRGYYDLAGIMDSDSFDFKVDMARFALARKKAKK